MRQIYQMKSNKDQRLQVREHFRFAETTFVTLTVSLLHACHIRQQEEVYWEYCYSSPSALSIVCGNILHVHHV